MNLHLHFIKLLSMVLLCTSFGYGYVVKLAVFKNIDGLQNLIAMIETKKDQNNIVIYDNKELNYAFTKEYKDEKEAKKALVRYKKIFLDAYIVRQLDTHITEKTNMNQNLTSMKKPVEPSENDTVLKEYLLTAMNEKDVTYGMTDLSKMRLVNKSPSLLWSKQLAFHKGIFYIRYMQGSAKVKAKVLKSHFKTGKLMYANLLDKNPTLGHAKYEMKQSELIIFDIEQKLVIHNRLEKVKDTYLVVSVSLNGKEVNKARYYYNKNDAIVFSN